MSRKTSIDITAKDVELRYSNKFSMRVNLISPTHLAVVAGRATSKTEDIIAERIEEIAYAMPGCFCAFTSDTFMNMMKNIIPGVVQGLKRKGWVEGLHFVVNEKPPKHFKKPFKVVYSWRYTLTVCTGTHFKFVSQDRPSIGAGDSFQHIIGDESKYLIKKKLNKLTPALRGGEIKFMKSHLYGGTTFVTDMPNPNQREHDWILDLEKNMDKERIVLIMQTALIVNEIRIELMHAKRSKEESKIILIGKKLARWEDRLNYLRTGTTYFAVTSSFANVDILQVRYFMTLLEQMKFREFKIAILSLRPKLEVGQLFYPTFTAKNFYSDGYTYEAGLDVAENPLDYVQTSIDLKYIDHTSPLEAGLDTGNMCSLAIGQPYSNGVYRILKFLYTLPKDFLPELGKKFRDYFKHHEYKHLNLYHDRAANQYKSVGEDHASKLKKAIEFDENGISTGWTVTLMNQGQATIYHQEEYELMLPLGSGANKNLPTLLIDSNTCKEIKSSIERAEKIIRENKDGRKTIHKNKNSEKMAYDLLPMFSTNPSDAVKYLVCRPEWMQKLNGETYIDKSVPGVY